MPRPLRPLGNTPLDALLAMARTRHMKGVRFEVEFYRVIAGWRAGKAVGSVRHVSALASDAGVTYRTALRAILDTIREAQKAPTSAVVETVPAQEVTP